MKVRRLFVVFGVLTVLVAVLSVRVLQPASYQTTKDVSLYLLGYTNTAGTNMVVLQLTNRTAALFMCFVGPRTTVASRNGRPLFHELHPAADPGLLQPRGAFTFAVPSSVDTNLWHLSVQLQELNSAVPKWRRVAAGILRSIGVHALDARAYYVTSPEFGRDE